ncbi:cytochrome P450 2U1-like [Branchiostoma floridae x Branchiostoma japonicum]
MATIVSLLQVVLSGHSMIVVLICFVAFLVSLVLVAKFSAHGRRNSPPGPPGWPVLGNLPSLTKDIHLQLTKWRYQYGDVFSVRFGLQDAVIVNGSEAIKEALVQKAKHFSNRPDYYLVRCLNMHFGLYPEAFFMYFLNSLTGLAAMLMRDKIQEECRHFCSTLRLLVGQPVELRDRLETSVSNIIVSMAVGKRFEYGDPKFGRLQALAERINVTFYKLYIVNCFPMLRFFPGFRKMYNELMDLTAELYNYIREHIETSCLTLCWGFLYLTAYPDVQEKVQAELDKVVGRDRPPAFSDRINLPYTEATIMEIQRIATFIPILPHRTSDDTTLLGYDIPAGMSYPSKVVSSDVRCGRIGMIVAMRWISMMVALWGGTTRTGYRRCWGEQMGKMELFLFLANTLQQFTLKLPEGAEPDFHGISTAFIYPRPFSLIVTYRD